MKEKIKNLKENKILKTIISIMFTVIYFIAFLIPYTLINSGYTLYAFPIFVLYFVSLLITFAITKTNLNIKNNFINFKNYFVETISFSLFINSLFVFLLSLINNEYSYMYSFGNYSAYSNVSDIGYLLIAGIIIPFFNNLFIRKNINRFKNTYSRYIIMIILSLLIMFVSPTIITGIYNLLIFILLSVRYTKSNNLFESTVSEIIISLTLVLMTLYLSEFKIIFLIISTLILGICILKNFKELIIKNQSV